MHSQNYLSNLPEQNKSALVLTDPNQALRPYNYPEERADEDDDEIDLRELWQVIVRRKWLILSIALLVLALTVIITFMMTPIYRASTTLQIDPENQNILKYDIQAQAQATTPNTKDFYQTQYELLQSNTLANRVIDQLSLESALKGDQLAKPFFAEQWDKFKLSLATTEATANSTDTDNAKPQDMLLGEKPLSEYFLANVSIAPVKNSQIVTVHYDDTDPKRAADIANALADNFIELNLERRRNAAQYAEQKLKEEVTLAQGRMLESEAKLNNYAKDKGIIVTDDKESLTSQKMRELNQALTQAENDRVKIQSDYEQASKAQGATTTLQNSTIQEMKKNLAKLQSEYQAGLSSSYAFDNPTIQGLKRQLAELQSQLQAETSSSRAFDNPTIQRLTQELAQLQSQYQGANSATNAFDNPTIQGMKRDLASLESDYREKAQIYKPAYPLMVQLQQKINSLKSDIAAETKSLTSSNKTNLKQRIDELQAQIARETRALNVNTQSNLRQQIAELQGQIQRETQALNSNTQTNLKQQISELQAQIAKETGNINSTIVEDLKAKYLAAKQREDALREQLTLQKDEYVNLRDKNVGYNEIKREVESNRNIYEGLLARQKEIGVAGGIGTNNIAVVDPAVIPFEVHKPNKKLNTALGAALGLFLGLITAFLLEFMDDRVRHAEDTEKLLGLPVLGIVPRSKIKEAKKLALLTQTDPRSAFAEAFRSLRTNLLFSTKDGTPKVLAITSAAASEGKSTTAVNLATVMAQTGKKVLLVDTDLRNPSIHKRLDLDNSKGLTNYLTGQDSYEAVLQHTQIPDVDVITAGPMSPNPVELLSSGRLAELFSLVHEGSYDMVVVDMPPVLGLADALIISNQATATILSIAMGETKKQALVGAFKRLRQARVNVIGTVASKAKQGTGYGYHYDYNYYGYGENNKLLEKG
ncbi:MAG: polysaccharide biosynthesis tyrosine autokinase [Thiothrix sp.]|nr:MAG: polysaccharide biosynthesis tyrosine autokinase [Thiothrix sp.]